MFRRDKLDAETDEELRAHLEMAAEENRRRGMSEEDARLKALRDFGGVTQVREAVRLREGLPFVENLRRDVGYALRQMRRSPGFAAVVIVTLALGIGANTAVFSVLNAVMLRPLAFAEAGRLVQILSVKGAERMGPSAPDMRDFADRNHTFDKLAVYDQWRKNVSTSRDGANAEEINVGLASADFFEALGVRPVMGRLFTANEGEAGHNHVAVISEKFWASRYQRDPRVLGRTLTINDQQYTIVGIVPATIPGWLHAAQTQVPIFEPFLPYPGIWSEQSRDGRNYGAIGLLKPGVTREEAEADLKRIAGDLALAYPVDHGFSVALRPLAEMRSGDLKPVLFVLSGAVGFILLIACSNLASLLLARNTARQREFAMRRALGAGRPALVRQVLAETLTFSLVGSVCGTGLAWAAVRALGAGAGASLPQLADLTLDWRVFAFALAAGLGTCLLFGIAPAWLSTRVDAAAALKEGGRNSSAPGQHNFRRALVTGQIALSLILLVGAGLLIQTLRRLEEQDPGFRIEHLVRGHIYLPPAQRYFPLPRRRSRQQKIRHVNARNRQQQRRRNHQRQQRRTQRAVAILPQRLAPELPYPVRVRMLPPQLFSNAIQIPLRHRKRHPRLQPPHHVDEPRTLGAIILRVRLEFRRMPKLHPARRVETARHHPNNRYCILIQRDLLVDHAWIAAKQLLPSRITQHHRLRHMRLIIVRIVSPPQQRPHPKHIPKARIRPRLAHRHRRLRPRNHRPLIEIEKRHA